MVDNTELYSPSLKTAMITGHRNCSSNYFGRQFLTTVDNVCKRCNESVTSRETSRNQCEASKLACFLGDENSRGVASFTIPIRNLFSKFVRKTRRHLVNTAVDFVVTHRRSWHVVGIHRNKR